MDRHDDSGGAPEASVAAAERQWRVCIDAVVSQADAAFGAVRLDRQRAAIERRVTRRAFGAHAHVLRFPGAVVRTAAAQPWRRWVAAAAIIGLVAGVAAGRFLLPHRSSSFSRALPGGGATPAALQMSPGDEAFLIELDAALAGPSGTPLRALDALTPDGR